MKKLQIGVKAIILDESGRFLMIKRSGLYGKLLEDMWDLPGGRINIGEEPEEGLHREIKEELGDVGFEILRPVHIRSVVNDKMRQIVRITYECKYKKGEAKLSKEHTACDWFSKEKLPRNIDRLAREAIESLGG